MIQGAFTWLLENRNNYDKMYNFSKPDSRGVKKDKNIPSWISLGSDELLKTNFIDSKMQQLKEFEIEYLKKNTLDSYSFKAVIQTDEDSKYIIDYDEYESFLNQKQLKRPHKMLIPENPYFRIIYATRTHSQIKEFISEIKKTHFARKFRIVHLASRTQYCKSSKIRFLKNNFLMKEKCDNLRKSKEGCDFYQLDKISNSKHALYHNAMDIEDVIKEIGENQSICPYFATKANHNYADVAPIII